MNKAIDVPSAWYTWPTCKQRIRSRDYRALREQITLCSQADKHILKLIARSAFFHKVPCTQKIDPFKFKLIYS